MILVKSICARDCPDSCFIEAVVENNRIVSVKGSRDNPVTDGFVCPRGSADPKRVYSKERVLYPRLRQGPKPGNVLGRVSWNRILDDVAGKLEETLKKDGPDKALFLDYAGNTGLFTSQYSLRLWNFLGVTRTDHSLCSRSGHEALSLHYGLSYGMEPEELLQKQIIAFWGFNAKVSSPHLWALALRARREKGTMLVVVDPRRSETAEFADLWLRPRPGSDVALAYGVAKFLIDENHVDGDFVQNWTKGFEAFRDEVANWTPERVEKLTGLQWDQVKTFAESMEKRRPGVIMIGIGLQKSLFGAEAVRAVSLLPVLLGYHRGFYYSNSKGRFIDFGYLTGENLTAKKGRIVSQVALAERLEAGEFRFIYIVGMNPAVTLPGQNAVRKGLSRNDVYVVVHDTHLTETCRFADAVLPAPTYLEKEDIVVADSHPYTRFCSRAVNPLGESREEVWVMMQLINRLKLSEKWLHESPIDATKKAMEYSFEDGTYQDLLKGAVLRLKHRKKEEYQTPAGKIEFFSSVVGEEDNHLPVQLPISRIGDTFILLNSALPQYTHSQFRDVYGPIPLIVWMHPTDAESRSIKQGTEITLFNASGELDLVVVVTDRVPQGVLWSPRPLEDNSGKPQNALVSTSPQRIGGGPSFNSTQVRVRMKAN